MSNYKFFFLVLASAVLTGLGLSACSYAGALPLPSAAVETLPPGSAVPEGVDFAADSFAEQFPDEAVMPLSFGTADELEGVSVGPVVPERVMVDDCFFSDTAFFGNSLMEGLEGFGQFQDGAFFAATSTALYNLDSEVNAMLDDGSAGTLYQAMTQRQYGKIYILLGINEIGWDAGYFADRYEEFLGRLQQDEPEAEVYIISLTPVTRELSDRHDYFNMDRIRACNEALLALAERTGCWYLDLCQALAGDDGYLPPERAAYDGIHFSVDTYVFCADFLRTHYA